MKKTDSNQSIMDSFRRIVRALRASSRSSQSDLGLRTAQLFVLQQLKKFEPLSLNELAEKTYSHQSTVSVVVDGLVKGGYIRRNSLKKDKRFLVLETTAQARTLLKKGRLTIQEQFSMAIEKMPPKHQRMLAELLEIFVSNAGLTREVPHFFFEKEVKNQRR